MVIVLLRLSESGTQNGSFREAFQLERIAVQPRHLTERNNAATSLCQIWLFMNHQGIEMTTPTLEALDSANGEV